MPSALHPALEPVSFLLGTWSGEGEGEDPGIVRTATGSPVTVIERRYRLVDGALAYELDMATEGVARTFHGRATLNRIG